MLAVGGRVRHGWLVGLPADGKNVTAAKTRPHGSAQRAARLVGLGRGARPPLRAWLADGADEDVVRRVVVDVGSVHRAVQCPAGVDAATAASGSVTGDGGAAGHRHRARVEDAATVVSTSVTGDAAA